MGEVARHERQESDPASLRRRSRAGSVLGLPAAAGLPAEDVARLGRGLTPLGAERAGNAEGTIPEWSGGIPEPPEGYSVGQHHRDPYAGDEPLFVIDAANLDEHRGRISVGHPRMLETYPTFRMPVYPTRRSASVPQRIHDATRAAAATAELVDDGNGVGGAVIGIHKQKVLAPPRLAGDLLLVHETINQVRETRKAWVYNPGQRRVRRAPNVAYDNPGSTSDGLRTADQVDMFNGAVDRYDWTLVGKREMYVPYNAYQLHGDALAFADILKPLHVNPEHLRYELHRVWVVEATLEDGATHLYKRRTFYVDEDSWSILLADIYDNRDQLWRVSEGHVINYYEKPLVWPTLTVHTDLQAGRYFASGLDNEFPMCAWDLGFTSRDFTPGALRREGRR